MKYRPFVAQFFSTFSCLVLYPHEKSFWFMYRWEKSISNHFGQNIKIVQKLANFRIRACFDMETVIPAYFVGLHFVFENKHAEKCCWHLNNNHTNLSGGSFRHIFCFLLCKTGTKENEQVLCFVKQRIKSIKWYKKVNLNNKVIYH